MVRQRVAAAGVCAGHESCSRVQVPPTHSIIAHPTHSIIAQIRMAVQHASSTHRHSTKPFPSTTHGIA
eukprot:745021-Rhodomonas_salina.1